MPNDPNRTQPSYPAAVQDAVTSTPCRILPSTKLVSGAPEPSDGHVSTGPLLRWLKTRLLFAFGRIDIGALDASHPPRRLEEPWFSMAFYDIFVMGSAVKVKLGAGGRSYVVVLVRAC